MTRSRLQTIRCASLLTPAGWRRDCVIQLNEKGRIESIVDDSTATAELILTGLVIPGIPNLHSHAHQRAIVGLTEHRAADHDDFWGWREMMYRANAAINPDQLQDIARYLYIDMLRQGYTSVTEFHYLHHQPNGLPYQNPAEMSERLIAAADEAGIAITLLPVLYCRGGFQDEPLHATQKRFFHTTDDYLQLLQQCQSLCANHPDRSIGIAAHSLRAASPSDIQTVIEQAGPALSSAPVHIHIAEQIKEVEDCLQVNGARPVDWLFDSCDVSERWCLIHATHISEAERS
ncbi:MAG: amidohydrolase family protein, partial [Gammaproteobacteria bacterium]